jgi:formamidopyrimidine-DNA glycosylase
MPELPDIALYLHALEPRVVGRPPERVRLASPFLVRTVDPPLTSLHGEVVRRLRRIGKRIVFEFDGPRFLVLHLMIAGRLRWKAAGAALTGRMSLAAFDFPDGTVILTEAGSKKRASLHVVAGEEALDDHDPGGLEVLGVSKEAFATRLAERRTLKRALTDPRVFSGIGNPTRRDPPRRAAVAAPVDDEPLRRGRGPAAPRRQECWRTGSNACSMKLATASRQGHGLSR